jgi:hypothetical protein
MHKTLQKIFFPTWLKKDGYTQNTNINTSFAIVDRIVFALKKR